MAFGVGAVLYGIWIIVQHLRSSRSVRLLPDRLIAPSGFTQANTEIPYDSIQDVCVRSVLWDKHLDVRFEGGALSIKSFLLSDRAAFQALVDGLSERVDMARGMSGDTVRCSTPVKQPGACVTAATG